VNLDFRTVEGVLIGRVLDTRIDAHATPDLKAKLGERIEKGESRVVLDLSAVELVDSTGLGGMLSLLKKMPRGGNLVLFGCRPTIVELLKLTRLDRVFPIAATEREALASFSR